MCGITGFIGQSNNHKLSYRLATALFDMSEIRGIDASGVWGAENGPDGNVYYNKQPGRSSSFVNGSFWEGLKKPKLDLLLMHARSASKGPNHARNNLNNHPFITSDGSIGMIHNGHLDEAQFLKDKYEVQSDTDSEFLLRIYEHAIQEKYNPIKNVPDDVSQRAQAISKIWSVISSGAMAVALGERGEGETRYLTLFHNDKRPLWLADLRKTLGQVFFFSSPEIWYQAISADEELAKQSWQHCRLIELPVDQIWMFVVGQDCPYVGENSLFKFKVKTNDIGNFWDKGEYCDILKRKSNLNIVTSFDKVKPEEPEFTGHEAICDDITKAVQNIHVKVTNLIQEGSITQKSYDDLVEYLNQTLQDLEGTSTIFLG